MDLDGKRALVTGGNRGIGKAIVLALIGRGAQVAINYRRGAAEAEAVLQLVAERGGSAVLAPGDVSDAAAVRAMIDRVVEHWGGLDILVNNAGVVGANHAITDISAAEWAEVVGVNLTGVFNCCKFAVPQLVPNHGKIVNISSIAGKMGGTIGCHYGASKAGVIGLTFALASELAPAVTVNAVAPGPVDTDLLTTETKERLAAQTPFGRIARPDEVAHTVIYLLENDYVSGEVVDINAGRYMD